MRIETDRLLLRDLREDDLDALAAIWTDPDVTRYMGGPRDPARIRDMLAEDLPADPPDPFNLWPVIEKATGRIVGHCGLLEKEVDGQDEVDLTYVFARSAWGQGYATEIATALRDYAFADLGLARLVAVIDHENTGSQRVALKVGMRYEKDALRSDGVTRRIYMMEAPVDAGGQGG
jgi:ribosomal-protein-alanine N-acetyltransferase